MNNPAMQKRILMLVIGGIVILTGAALVPLIGQLMYDRRSRQYEKYTQAMLHRLLDQIERSEQRTEKDVVEHFDAVLPTLPAPVHTMATHYDRLFIDVGWLNGIEQPETTVIYVRHPLPPDERTQWFGVTGFRYPVSLQEPPDGEFIEVLLSPNSERE